MNRHKLPRIATTPALITSVITALLAATPAAHAAGALPPGAIRVQQAEIVDHKGFERPLVAATMMVPAGWQVQGQVEWNVGKRCGQPNALRMQAAAPDGSAAIELVPGEAWGTNNYGGPAAGDCPQANIANTQQYLAAWVQQHRPGARVIDYRARPDKSTQPMNQAFPGGGSFSYRVESGQALIGYQKDGREMRETLVANVAFSQSVLVGLGGRQMQSMQGQSLGVLAWRAPEGALDFKQFDAVWGTLRPGAEWKARMDAANAQMSAENAATQRQIAQINAQTSRETLAHIARRGEIMRQTREDVANIRNSTYTSTQATNDRMHTDSVRTVREVQGYRTASGNVVELSSHYNHAWQLRDGSYVLTDSPNFDPARDIGIAGQQMVRTRDR